MKFKKLVLLFFCLFLGTVNAQEIILNKYNFGEGIVLSGADDDYKIEFTGYIQPYMETKKYLDNDDDALYSRFRLRRTRFLINGNAAQEKLTYRLQLDLTSSGEGDSDLGNMLFDAWVGYDVSKNISISFGQKGTPTDNRELMMRSNTLQLVERSPVTSAFSSIREFGLFLDASYKLNIHSYIRPKLTITNGDGVNVFTKDRGGLKYGGRIDYIPFGLFTNFGQSRQADIVRELTPKLVFGINYSYNVGISDRRGRESGSILYLDDNGNEALPDYVKFGADFLFKYKGFSLLGEYVNAKARVPGNITQRVRQDGSTTSSFEVNGIQDVENYVKGRMMLGEGYNIQGGYMFKNLISVDARFAYIKPDEHSFLHNETFFNRSHFYTVGISKYLDRNYGAKIQFDVTYINGKNGTLDVNGNPLNGNEIVARLITTISF